MHQWAVPAGAEAGQPRPLLLLAPGLDPHDLDRLLLAGCEPVLADHHTPARLHPLLEPVGALGDPPLHPAGLDRGDRATLLVDLGHDPQRLLLDLVGQRLHVMGATQGIRDRWDIGLVADHLLGPQGDLGSQLRRQPERFVIAVGVERLGSAEHRAHGLQGGADDVDEWLLGGERHPSGLGVEAEHQ